MALGAGNWYASVRQSFLLVKDDDGDEDVSGAGEIGPFNEYSSQEMSQALSSFNSNETVFHGDNLVAQPNKVRDELKTCC